MASSLLKVLLRVNIFCVLLFGLTGCDRTTDQSNQSTGTETPAAPAVNSESASSSLLADDSTWIVFESKEGGLKITFPGDPQINAQTESQGNFLVKVEGIEFRLVYMNLRTKLFDLSKESLEPHLTAARDGAIKAAKGNLLSSEITEVDGLARIALSYEVPSNGSLSYGQYAIDGTRIFGFGATGPKDVIKKSVADRFLNSFTLTSPPKPQEKFATLDEFFKVIDDVEFVEQDISWQGESFVISTPMDATVESLESQTYFDTQFKLNLATGEFVEFLVGEWDMNERRRVTRSFGRFSKVPLKGFAFSDDETLIVEKGDKLFNAYMNLTLGPRQFCIRLKASDKKLFDQTTCALLLKSAKTLTLKTPYPTDPNELVKRLGIEYEPADVDFNSVTSLSFPNNTSPKMVELVEHFPNVQSVKVAVVWNSKDFLLPLTKCPNLKQLELPKNIGSSTKFLNKEMEIISQCVALEKLNMSVSSVKPENLNHLQKLKQLTTLDVRNVTDESKLKKFAESIPSVNVRIHSLGKVTWESKPE